MEQSSYRIGELAEKAGVTKRTIHYYMGRGLLPTSEGAGLGTTYSDEHLYRIMLIKKLQDAWLPLDEIRKRISGMSLQDVIKSLAGNNTAMMLSELPAEYSASVSSDDYSPSVSSAEYSPSYGKSREDSQGNPPENLRKNLPGNQPENLRKNLPGNLMYKECTKENASTCTVAYERINIGSGLELHFQSDNKKAREMAEILYKYAQKMMKEG